MASTGTPVAVAIAGAVRGPAAPVVGITGAFGWVKLLVFDLAVKTCIQIFVHAPHKIKQYLIASSPR